MQKPMRAKALARPHSNHPKHEVTAQGLLADRFTKKAQGLLAGRFTQKSQGLLAGRFTKKAQGLLAGRLK